MTIPVRVISEQHGDRCRRLFAQLRRWRYNCNRPGGTSTQIWIHRRRRDVPEELQLQALPGLRQSQQHRLRPRRVIRRLQRISTAIRRCISTIRSEIWKRSVPRRRALRSNVLVTTCGIPHIGFLRRSTMAIDAPAREPTLAGATVIHEPRQTWRRAPAAPGPTLTIRSADCSRKTVPSLRRQR